MKEFYQQRLGIPYTALQWKKSGPEWQAAPKQSHAYGIIKHGGLWYPYYFEGRRYKRGRQLGVNGYITDRQAKLCAEAHWLDYQIRD